MQKMKKRVLALGLTLMLILTSIIPGVGTVTAVKAATSAITISEANGWFESAYVEWKPVSGAKRYDVYVKASSGSSYTRLDDELVRQYPGYWRADAVGLAAGTYDMKVIATLSNGTVSAEKKGLVVNAYDRSGFAFSSDSTYKTGSGAYNEDGTLKPNAQVIYVTKDTAKTVTAALKNGSKTVTATGIQAILKAKDKDTETPLAIRIIGCISDSDVDYFGSSSEGIQIKGAKNYQEMNITIEGIGEDATVNGFGFLVRNAGNVEFRNFAVINFMDDGISMDTANTNIWIHNMDFFYGSVGSDADQAKGDGTVDLKGNTQWTTISYNHFYDSGKMSLCGMKSESGPNYITYHHNWFDHSDSRHPRIRTMSVHIYNNYYDGNAKYGVGAAMQSDAFVESNYFYNCKYPMLSSMQGSDIADGNEGTFSGEDGGIIKAYNNRIVGAKRIVYANSPAGTTGAADSTQFDAVLVSSRTQTVPSTYKGVKGSHVYNNFDTKIDLGVSASDIDDVDSVPSIVKASAGRMNGGDLKYTFNASENENYAVIPELKNMVVNYKTTLYSVGGVVDKTAPEPTEPEKPTEPETEAPTQKPTEKPTEPPTEKPTEAPTQKPSGSETFVHNFTVSGKTSSFFAITGNLSTGKGTVSYNGLKLTQCLKMESSTSVKFTADAKGTLTLVFVETNKAGVVSVDGKSYNSDSKGVVELAVSKGSHTITKVNTSNLFYIELKTESTETPTETPTEKPTEKPTEPPTEKPTEAPTEAPTQKPSVTETVVHNFTKSGKTSSFFAITGNLSTGKGTVSYNGLKLTQCLKMESSTSIKFTADAEGILTLVFVETGKEGAVKVDGKSYNSNAGGVVEVSVKAGAHTVTKANTANLFYMSFASDGGSGTVTPTEPEKPTQPDDGNAEGDIYVSPSGKTSASGSSSDPMDFVTALSKVKAGNTIWMKAGTYNYTSTIVIAESNSGTSSAYKSVKSKGGDVVIDFTGMKEDGANRGIVLDGSYWHFYDIDIANAGDNGMLLSGDHNIIELCQFYQNHDSGLQLSRYNTNYGTKDLWPSYNLIKNCTSFNNKDEATSENADGFAAKLTCGEGNVFDGCMAYCNSDDGWDLYAKPETGSIGVVTIKNCVAFGNGKTTDGQGSANGDMNGFKLGGSNGACPTPHVITNCLAFFNGATGFTDNGNGGAIKMTNCTAANNGVYSSKSNFMCYRTSQDALYSNLLSFVSNGKAGTDKFKGALEKTLYYNTSGSSYYWVDKKDTTSFTGSGIKYGTANAKTVSNSDFVSTTLSGYDASKGIFATNYHETLRNSDGSINMNGLFQLKSSSPLYNAGTNGAAIGAAL